MNRFSLSDLLKASGERMRGDLAQRLVPHLGELGIDREEIIRQFLRAYLPKCFEVSTCCGSIETDTFIRVLRWSEEVSEDDRQTPYLY